MLTGSISSWIEKNILSRTGFVGHISLDMTLEELPLQLISVEVIEQVQKKIKALPFLKSFSIRPVLIHVNGVSDQVKAQNFFSRYLDFSQLLQMPVFE